MATRLLVNVRTGEEPAAIDASGVEVLARYPDTVLVRGTDEQVGRLQRSGVEATPLPDQPVQVAGNSFAFADAVAAQGSVEVAPAPTRTAYYLLKLVGPAAPEWLADLRAAGAEVHDNLADFTLLAGLLPARLADVRALPWVEDVTPYRPAMKLSPRLRGERRRSLDAGELATPMGVAADSNGDRDADGQLVEVSVFPGESVTTVAGRIREAGGSVLRTTGRTVVASVRTDDIARLADQQAVQAILPHDLPELHNDKAARVMRVPADHTFAGTTLTGSGQLVGIADSGLDTGDPATVHVDVRGRVAGIVSRRPGEDLEPLLKKPPEDDGPADTRSGHGTHVTGSVLGNGAAAVAAGADLVPAGIAPEASVFFQAIEHEVHWKDADELRAAGIPVPPGWPPKPVGLYGLPSELGELFDEAYGAGARIHTNSWGARVAGEYNENAHSVDDFMFRHPDMLLLFSAGNEGLDRDADGVIDPDSVGSPGTAKNCLTVGASENNRPAGSVPKPGIDRNWNQLGSGGVLKWPALASSGHVSDNIDGMAAFSSRGPVDGERIKPDVVAPGTNVASMLSSQVPASEPLLWGRLPAEHPLHPTYCWSGGTSMSTPLVAGAAALVRQHLVERREHLPSGSLVKAVLVNGAVPMLGQFSGEVPAGGNNVSGFGRVDVTASLDRMVFAQAPEDAVGCGELRLYRLDDVEAGRPLHVTLVWTDAPSPPGNGGLVNHLYLQLETPDGTVLDGDVTPYPTATNNVQRIVVPAPVAGTYTIRVRGLTVTSGSPGAPTGELRQDFAVVASDGASLTRTR